MELRTLNEKISPTNSFDFKDDKKWKISKDYYTFIKNKTNYFTDCDNNFYFLFFFKNNLYLNKNDKNFIILNLFPEISKVNIILIDEKYIIYNFLKDIVVNGKKRQSYCGKIYAFNYIERKIKVFKYDTIFRDTDVDLTFKDNENDDNKIISTINIERVIYFDDKFYLVINTTQKDGLPNNFIIDLKNNKKYKIKIRGFYFDKKYFSNGFFTDIIYFDFQYMKLKYYYSAYLSLFRKYLSFKKEYGMYDKLYAVNNKLCIVSKDNFVIFLNNKFKVERYVQNKNISYPRQIVIEKNKIFFLKNFFGCVDVGLFRYDKNNYLDKNTKDKIKNLMMCMNKIAKDNDMKFGYELCDIIINYYLDS